MRQNVNLSSLSAMKKLFLLSYTVLLSVFSAQGESVLLSCERVPFDDKILESKVWDVNVQSVIDENSDARIEISERGFVQEYAADVCQLYLHKRDTLIWRGYTEGRNLGVLLDSVALCHIFPLQSDAHSRVHFIARQESDGKVFALLEGDLDADVVCRGKFILAMADTIPATLTREKRVYSVNDADNGGQIYTDSVVIHRWYTSGARMPMALQVSASGAAPRFFACESFDYRASDDMQDMPDEAALRDIAESATVTKANGKLYVELCYAQGVTADVCIVDVSGNTYGRELMPLDNVRNEVEISITGLNPGSYLLVIQLSGENMAVVEKRILAL